MSPRRFLVTCAAVVVLAFAASAANAAQVVNGTITPAKLKGKSTVVMFLHPF
jgi:hypothetical protein